jgi:hypothetical protein
MCPPFGPGTTDDAQVRFCFGTRFCIGTVPYLSAGLRGERQEKQRGAPPPLVMLVARPLLTRQKGHGKEGSVCVCVLRGRTKYVSRRNTSSQSFRDKYDLIRRCPFRAA